MKECRKKTTFGRCDPARSEQLKQPGESVAGPIRGAEERQHTIRTTRTTRFAFVLLALLLAALFTVGCLNPFAPEEGVFNSSLWDEQTSVGGLLENFRTAYRLRDSVRYADLLAEEFVFQYFDLDLSRYEQWYRETELRVTGGLMRNVDNLDLRWGPIPISLDTLSNPDTTVEFTINYSLTAGELASLSGFARFRVRAGSDSRFRIVFWGDDF